MYIDEYYGHLLDGHIFINQLIEYGIIDQGFLSPEPRIIETPEVSEFYENDWDRCLHWEVHDEDPSTFEIYQDGALMHSEPWSYGEWEIEYSLNSLSIGEYNITLHLLDVEGNSGSDTVMVSIIEDTDPPVLSSPLNHYFFLNSVLEIYWLAEDNNPCYYQISINGSTIIADEWTHSPAMIGVSVEDWIFSPGVYEFELLVSDCVHNVTDTVLVYALPSTITATTQTSPLTSFTTTTPIYSTSESTTSSTSTTTVDTQPTNTNSTTTPWWNAGEVWQVMSIVITIGSVVVMIVFVVLIIRSRK
jgi:hypothetical protein